MRSRLKYIVPVLLVVACVGFLWLKGHQETPPGSVARSGAGATGTSSVSSGTNSAPAAVKETAKVSAACTNRLAYRLANTPRTIGQLMNDQHAILLENAFIDTTTQLDLKIPSHLKSKGDPGAYIVQAKLPLDSAFRSLIAGAGGDIISYIPNNAFLVQMSAGAAAALEGNGLVQTVVPYEPYYKIQASLLGLAIDQQPLPPGMFLTLGIYAKGAATTLTQIEQLGGQILSQDRSPFGLVVHIRAPADWLAIADLPGVQLVEPSHLRVHANDLSRVALGVSTDTLTNTDYLGLYGSNVVVQINDSGVDTNHPDFLNGNITAPGPSPVRVLADSANSMIDFDGHGTHVAGIIAGDGAESLTMTNVPSGSVTNADFRGKAPMAWLYSVAFFGSNHVDRSDSYLQTSGISVTNVLISNNSWVNGGDNEYDLSAASYDAAVRDALPQMTGPQPELFVFAAGNGGGGGDDGSGGNADTINSPATAKNVITVGATEQLRNITNVVTLLNGTSNQFWASGTDSRFQVASYSARGNVGVLTEGPSGRFKPDVVAPGTFVVSTRATTWDQGAYYNPTNFHAQLFQNEVVASNLFTFEELFVPENSVGVLIQALPNAFSPVPFPTNMPIFVSAFGFPDPSDSTTYDFATSNDMVSIPPDSGGLITDISAIQNSAIDYAVGAPTNSRIVYDLFQEAITTNDNGNELQVLSNLNNTIGPFYRYETGTSMAAGSASGVLALMDDFFVNQRNPNFPTNPSPALLKAMLINGARMTGGYQFEVTNVPNIEGWGQIELSNSIPFGLTNTAALATNNTPMFFVDQSPTNVLQTGDQRTYIVKVLSAAAQSQMLRVTLAWTDPPGNPAAAIKLVNHLEVVVTNLDNGRIYYANNFGLVGPPPVSNFSLSNDVPLLDPINNVKNIAIPPSLSTNYSVTVIGTAVNVNAVTTEQTNIVQDFALVISCGDGDNTNGISVTPAAPSLAPAFTPRVGFVPATNGVILNQIAGSSAPWLNTNDLPFPVSTGFAANSVFHVGQTNQWQFYVVTNTFAATNSAFTNAAFIVFLPNSLSLPREGVNANSDANSTRPEADLNLLVASSPDSNPSGLTNLNMTVISNCLFGVNGDAAAVGRGGTKVVTFTNSAGSQVYYIGVQSADQTAGQFGFIPIFSATPFSTLDSNGNQHVTGLPVPRAIPDGDNQHPGSAYVFGIALYPMPIGRVIVTNTFAHQNFGDLVGSITHDGSFAILNNHDGYGTITPAQPLSYDDSGRGDVTNNFPVKSDGPGSLNNFIGDQAPGLWLLTEIDDTFTHTGSIASFNTVIEPHHDLGKLPLLTVSIPPGTWFYDFVDAEVGDTNLLVVATNLPPTIQPNPVQLYVKRGSAPTFTDTNFFTLLTNCLSGTYPTGVNPGNSISIGPPLIPDRYFVGLFNPGPGTANVLVGAILSFNASAITTLNYNGGPVPLKDDAVTYSDIFVTNADLIQHFNVGLRVDHQRISDLSFTLIDPNNNRYLLMENRGGQTTNGCGLTVITTNIIPVSSAGTNSANTNSIDTGIFSGTFPISYNFFTVPDQMRVYYGTTVTPANLIFDTGLVSGSNSIVVSFPPSTATTQSTMLTIVMNQFGNPATNGDLWAYTAGGVLTNFYYLAFTEDTNLTTTPIKYAAPPFVPAGVTDTNNYAGYTNWSKAVGGDGHWFKAVAHNNITWDTCDAIAHAAGGHLAVPNTSAKNDFIFSLIDSNQFFMGTVNNNGSGPAFGGIYTNTVVVPNRTNGWTWENHASWGPFINWFPGQPDNFGGNQNRTCYYSNIPSTPGKTWDDINENDLNVSGYIIELEPPTNTPSNLYDLAEVSLDPLIGTPANGSGIPGVPGRWRLEVLDNRAGATNSAVLDSWQLAFQFANTNLPPPVQTITITNGPVTNTLPANSIEWFLVQTPTNADIATNSLLFSSLPISMWYSTNTPPTITNTTDVQLLGSSVGPQSAVLGTIFGTNPPPAFFTPGGSYYLGFENTNSTTATFAFDVTFHLIGVPPSIITEPATNITFNSAVLNALVVPNALTTTVWFEYGTTTNYGSVTTNVVLNNNLNLAQGVAIGVTGLSPATLYHFQAVATNDLGTNFGGDLTFMTPLEPPFTFTMPATLLTGPGAQLNGMATPNGLSSVAWFEYGTSSTYGQQTTPVGVGSGSMVIYVTNQIIALNTNQPYHFRLDVSNSLGVAFGYDHVFDQASVAVWGANNNGQTTPIPTSLGNLVVGLGAGADFSLAVNYNGTVAVWGDGNSGETNVPAGLTNGMTNAVSVRGGNNSCIALTSVGNVIAWGGNNFFQTNIPPNLTNAVEAECGTFHDLALTADGNVVAWGANFTGQATVPPGLSNVVEVAGGLFHSIALKNDGTVVAWGNDGNGQLDVPPGLSNVVAIAAGDNFNWALRNDGSVVGWGENQNGQTNTSSLGNNVLAIAAGGSHGLALFKNGTIQALGDPTANLNFPTNSVTNVVAVACGQFHNLVLTSVIGLNVTNAPPFWTNNLNGSTVTMNEQTTLVVTNTAVDTNFPALTLTYVLLNPPGFASINPLNGLITFTPGEADGPSTNVITTVVVNNGQPPLSNTNSFTLIVNEVNTAPSFANAPTDYHIVAGNMFIATNAASDSDIPVNPLTYTLLAGPPGGALMLDSSKGVIGWPTTSATIGNSYTFTNMVTDSNQYALFNQSLSATNVFTVTVVGTNFGPFWLVKPLPDQTAYVTNLFTFTVTASDTDAVPPHLTYSLGNAPTGMSISNSSGSGVIFWTPTNSQGGLTFPNVQVIVSDNVLPSPKTATNTFNITVLTNAPPPVNPTNSVGPFVFSSIVATNFGGTNGFLLTWFAPTNDLFQVQWKDDLTLPWQAFTNIVSYNLFLAPTNSQFQFFDDGTQAPFESMRCYRLLLLQAATNTLTLPAQTNRIVGSSAMVVVTNIATDSVSGAILTYSLVNPPPGAIITNGVITWPSATPSGLAARFTTIASDDSVPQLVTSNTFTVFITPLTSITNVTITPTNVVLNWTAPTNDLFNIRWATNLLAPINWQTFPGGPFSSTTGIFSFTNNNPTGTAMKFYQLILMP